MVHCTNCVYGTVCAVYGTVCAVYGTVCAVYGTVCAVYGTICAVYGTDCVNGKPVLSIVTVYVYGTVCANCVSLYHLLVSVWLQALLNIHVVVCDT